MNSRKVLKLLPPGLLGILLLLLVASISGARTPEIKTAFADATIEIAADKAWSILPGDCREISWRLEGIKSLYIDGEGQIGWGETTYCPTLGAASPAFRITAQNGDVRTFRPQTYFLPTELLRCLLFVAILLLFVLTIYYFMNYRPDEPLPMSLSTAYAAGIGILACLLGTATGAFSTTQALQSAADVFADLSWQFFGLFLGALVFIPLVVESLRRGAGSIAKADAAAVAAFFLVLCLLYYPFGFDSIGHQEEWMFRAFFEGRDSKISAELATRFWALIPHAFAMIIDKQSFGGDHFLTLLMMWGTISLFYVILRQLKISPCFAFMSAMLALLYPVNPALFSLRALNQTFSKVALLAAVALALDFDAKPGRLRLLGIWLALLFCIGSYENAYVIIACVPLLWWWRTPSERWRNLNMSLLWYLFPAAKVAYLLLYTINSGGFYGSYQVVRIVSSGRTLIEHFNHYSGILADVYRQTFITGWLNAIGAIEENLWFGPTLLAAILIAAVIIYMGRGTDATAALSSRKLGIGVLAGCLLILPAVGVMMWLEQYNRDLWRMYHYVPFGAAIAVTSLIFLIAHLFRREAHRKLAIVFLMTVVVFPALSRLYVQHSRMVDSSSAKADVLIQIVEQVSRFDPDADVILLTDLGLRELGESDLYDFRRATLDSAIYILYEGFRPRFAVLCWSGKYCNPDDWLLTNFEIQDIVPDASKLVVFRLHEDLSVELLRLLPPELGIADAHNYDPVRLIDSSAPLPPRGITMLGAAGD